MTTTEKPNFELALRENVPLAPMTTIGIGGPARYFAEAGSEEQLAAGIRWSRARKLPLFVLGGGSNIVVADNGFPGLVIRIDIRGIDASVNGDRVVITAGAGELWDPLVAACVAKGWLGFECMSGIPGRVGATPIQNVGAYGQETSETLQTLEAFDTAEDKFVRLNASDCQFGYRTSRFKTVDRDRFIITRVTYSLAKGGKPEVRYPEVQKFLAAHGLSQPTVAEIRQSVLAIRMRKNMVVNPADSDSRSVGSFFVNPIVGQDQLEDVRRRAAATMNDSEEMPVFPAARDQAKLSAAWLIEHAGIKRGYVHGNVGTSTNHALAIINRMGGTAREVIELKNLIQTRVQDAFGVELVPEPVFVGFEE